MILLTLLSCYKLNRCYIKLSLVNILEMFFVFIEILFKILLFKGGVLIYAEHCTYIITLQINDRLPPVSFKRCGEEHLAQSSFVWPS